MQIGPEFLTALFAMAAAILRAHTRAAQGHPDAEKALDLVDLFCRSSRRKVKRLFHELWHNEDDAKYRIALQTLAGEHTWLERGILAHDEVLFPASLRPRKHESGPAEHIAGEPLTYP